MSPEPVVTITRYEVSCLPQDHLDRHALTVTVEYRGRDRWAVCHFSSCYGLDGTRSHESIPSERRDEWLAQYRHDLITALALAKQVAPQLVVNGHTVADVLAHGGEQ